MGVLTTHAQGVNGGLHIDSGTSHERVVSKLMLMLVVGKEGHGNRGMEELRTPTYMWGFSPTHPPPSPGKGNDQGREMRRNKF